MSQSRFEKYVKDTRDCDEVLLNIAVKNGLRRAKNESLDFRKIIELAGLCAVTATFCIMASLEPVKMEAERFLISNSMVTQSDSEVLHQYLNNITTVLGTYLIPK